MGARFRLKASFDISGFSPANQVILTALKQYGMMLADNGSAWYLSGAPNDGWNNDDLHKLTTILGSNFEAVDATVLMVDPNTGQAAQTGVSVTVSPSSANLQVNAQQQFTATVHGNSDQTVTWDVNGTVGGNSAVGTIDSISGLYTAPPTPVNVTVHASSSVVTPPAVGSASVTVVNPQPPPPVGVSISPTSATVRVKGTQQFTATVQGSTNTKVTWKVTGPGSISTTGLYKAPNNFPSQTTATVTATSVADTTKSASAAVTIIRR